MSTELISLDTGSAVVVHCQNNDDRKAIDLTGATVTWSFKIDGGTLQIVTMTIVDAINGIARYLFVDNEIAAGEVIVGETIITDGIGNEITQLVPFVFPLRGRLS